MANKRSRKPTISVKKPGRHRPPQVDSLPPAQPQRKMELVVDERGKKRMAPKSE